MTQKITLSIPDLLHEKLKEWRNSFNFSKMFQEAVSEAIQKKEEFQKRFSEDFEMPQVIKRLKQEKYLWEKKYYKLGQTEGFRWAKTAHYEDLVYVLQFDKLYDLVSDSRMAPYFEQIYQKTDLTEKSHFGEIDKEQMFLNGWHKGILGFWNQVKGEL